MSLNLLTWLFVLAVLIHNTEEAIFLPAWSKTAGRWHAPVTASQFRFAVIILTLLLVVIALFASIEPPRSIASYLMSGYVLAMQVNVLFPHLVATLFMRRYMPGTATALLSRGKLR